MRLIDADALRKAHCEDCAADVRAACEKDPICSALMWVDEAPTIDAVEVVRCKDCEYWNTDEKSYFGTKCRCERFSLVGYSENYVLPNDFCSYGERRENNALD